MTIKLSNVYINESIFFKNIVSKMAFFFKVDKKWLFVIKRKLESGAGGGDRWRSS